ncbi:CDP-diacylglycerol--serine O-phosphatidyltransferase, partial [Rhodococcus sp. CX]|nr:CDP-diacylglycerol--serine O-phosphatidyltransferase [Rhodococcus sp. CX]
MNPPLTTPEPERKRRGRPQAVRLLPSVITILALSAGLSAVKFALDGELGT